MNQKCCQTIIIPNNIFIFNISGNIASGKSTIMDKLSQLMILFDKCFYFKEDVTSWEESLQEFYDNPNEETFFILEGDVWISYFQLTKKAKNIIKEYKDKEEKVALIFERSVMEADKIFLDDDNEDDNDNNENENNNNNNNNKYKQWIKGEKMQSLKRMFQVMSNDSLWSSIYTIYIDSSINNCYERCIKRSRKSENKITKEYLTKLDNSYKKWLKELKNYEIIKNEKGDNIEQVSLLIINKIQQIINKTRK